MIERPCQENEVRWKLKLGPGYFEQGPLREFGGNQAVEEFRALQKATNGLLAGASIPALAMRAGPSILITLLRYFPTVVRLLSLGELATGTFAPFMDGPLFVVKSKWLRNWLDALAFSLSGLPASRTSAAAMAFVINDMHRSGATLDYPRGGMGTVVDALVRGVEQGTNGSRVHLSRHVAKIDFDINNQKATGITLKGGIQVRAKDGIICNAPVWSLRELVKEEKALELLGSGSSRPYKQRFSWTVTKEGPSIAMERPVSQTKASNFLEQCDSAEKT